MRIGAHEFTWIRVLGGTTDMFQSPGKRAHQTIVVRLPAALLVTVDAACEPVVHRKRVIHSLPFYGGKEKTRTRSCCRPTSLLRGTAVLHRPLLQLFTILCD